MSDQMMYEVTYDRDDIVRALASHPRGYIATMHPGPGWRRKVLVGETISLKTCDGITAVRLAMELGVPVRRIDRVVAGDD